MTAAPSKAPALPGFDGPGNPRRAPLGLTLARFALQALFGLLSLFGRTRATHSRGIGVQGTARIVDNPRFPAHDFFVPGKSYPVVLRHANLTFGDDRMRDIRSATLRFGGLTDQGLFDMPMNTGETSAFWNVRSFVDFLVASIRGTDALRAFSAKYPLADVAARNALSRGPSSFADLAYYGQLVYRFQGTDGRDGFVRYRLVPEHSRASAEPLDLDPWIRDRDPADARPADYLATEYRSRLQNAPVCYRFQLQYRDVAEGEDLHSGRAWNDEWLDVAAVTIDNPLSDDQAERLQFNLGNHPPSLGILTPRSTHDYNSLAFLRVRVYRFSQRLRLGRKRRQPQWDYRLHSALPRVSNAGGRLPEGYTLGRSLAGLSATSLRLYVLYGLHLVLSRVGLISAATIQRHHVANLSMRAEAREPGSSRSDAWLVDRLLNGYSPLPVHRVDADPEQLVIDFNWDSLAFDGPLELPNARACLRRDGPTLRLEEIRIQHRVQGDMGPNPRLEPPRIARPGDGARWELARFLFRNNWMLEGQALAHFVCCHINGEQYAVAAHRQLHQNPIRALLFPHLKELVAINEQGNGTIFGEHGVLTTNSALRADSANALFVTHLGRLSWAGWRPREPLCDEDRFARIATLYWDLLSQYCGEFVERHRDGIARHWLEIWAFSRDLVFFGVPHASPRQVPGASLPTPPRPHIPAHSRVRIDGTVKALHPLTLARQDPTAADLADLVQLCTYVIFHLTLFHTWTNDVMHDDLGELAYANGGVDSALVRRLWDARELPPLLPPPYQAGYQLFFANYLSRIRHGFLLRNEEGDIPAELIAAVRARREDFAALGFDIEDLRGWINI